MIISTQPVPCYARYISSKILSFTQMSPTSISRALNVFENKQDKKDSN